MKCRFWWMNTAFESIAILAARDPLFASLRESEATRMSEKRLRILLAEGLPGETAAALRAL